MSREDIYKQLNGIFCDIFDEEDITINDETTSNDIDGWDSLEHINLIMAIELSFGIKFQMGEINKFKNVGEMVDIIVERIN